MRICKTTKKHTNTAMRIVGLDGNKRFQRPQEGYVRAVDVLHQFGIELLAIADSHLFDRDSGKVVIDIAMTNPKCAFSPIALTNAVLVVSFQKLRENNYEVIAYIS